METPKRIENICNTITDHEQLVSGNLKYAVLGVIYADYWTNICLSWFLFEIKRQLRLGEIFVGSKQTNSLVDTRHLEKHF